METTFVYVMLLQNINLNEVFLYIFHVNLLYRMYRMYK